ncbi:ABC spermidine/putrescine transporter, inner membrane subunit [Rubellimicrobium mesophilum DSM 19309]|uniref:ABC spermidine/putrescine transporter, inner membrane subunit n=1 Tax=Rubellimicrobium mesophilum DSM 19309 TaxID=442562 RepID=A0A017HQJ8_9RHOB|nr:ABC spermidine/putrescine transporter, inner membrane subunit [Rubellimicrobium mesophilum DSM 19309]
MRWSRGTKRIATTLGIGVFFFLYAPLLVLIVFSFSGARTLSLPIESWTLDWYRELAADEDLKRAALNSLKVAAAVVPLTLLLGVPAGYALGRFAFRGSQVVEHLLTLPLMIPGIVTGLSILLLLKAFGLPLSLWAVVLGHAVAWLPVVIGQVMARLSRLDPLMEEASLDLGAGYLETFLRVVLPNLSAAVIGGGLLVFTLSFDEVAITFLLTGSENTLPMQIWAMLRQGVTPEICAVATLTILASAALIALSVRLGRR